MLYYCSPLPGPWIKAAGRHGAACFLAVDITGAFDRVRHACVLLYKSKRFGLSALLLTWLSSYLTLSAGLSSVLLMVVDLRRNLWPADLW